MHHLHHLTKCLAPMLVAGAIAAPAASARVALDPAVQTAKPAAPASADLRSPDARDAARGAGPGSVERRYEGSVLQAVRPPATVHALRITGGGSGFDWADAGIGGAAGIAFALVAFGLTAAVRDRRPPQLASGSRAR